MTVIRVDFRPNKPGTRKGAVAVYRDGETTPLACDTFDIASDDRRTEFVNKVTKTYSAIPAEELVKALLEKAGEALKRQGDGQDQDERQEADPLSETSQEVIDDAMEILRGSDLFERILADIESTGVAGEDDLKLTIYVVMTSRLMDKPLSVIVQGASSSGKSFIIETGAKLMPPEAVVQAHDFTDQALYYLPVGSLEHKVVVSGERVQEHRGKDGQAQDNSKAFREMVGSGVLRKAVTIKGPDGKPTTELIEQPGPIAFLESSTAAHINDEDSTRLLPLVTDESAEQTAKIVEAQRRAAKGLALADERKKEIVLRHQTLQRLLKPVRVRIPWIDSISLPVTNVATRRTYDQLRYAISSVAFLRQYQKEMRKDPATGEEFIEADATDYAVAYRLMKGVLLRKYSPLDSHARDMLQIIVEHTATVGSDGAKQYDEFTQADCERWTGVSNATVRRRLVPLVAVGILSEDASGKPYKYRVVKADLAKAIDLHLPTPEDIAERIAIMSDDSVGEVTDD
jgi:DNA primase